MLQNLLLLIVLCWNTVACAQVDTEPLDTILVVGDSLSAAYGITPQQGWVHLLAQRLHKQGYKYQVVNASISGETTSGGLTRLPNLLQQHQPTIVIVELGGNDGLRGLSLQEMRTNLAKIIQHSQQVNAKVLLLGMRIPPNYGKSYTERFYIIYQELAKEYTIALVPFFLEGVGNQRKLMQEDGIHPTAEAQPRLLDNLWKQLETLLTVKQPS